MDELRRRALLENLLGVGSPHLESHLVQNQAWNDVVLDTLRTHLDFCQELIRASPSPIGRESDIAVRAIITHAYNLACVTFGLGYRGLFDIAGYAMRPLHDAAGLAFLCGSDQGTARRVAADDEVKAADGRRALVRTLRESGDAAVADQLDASWRDRSKSLDTLAHTRLFHLDRVVTWNQDRLTYHLGGIDNHEAFHALLRVAHDAECDLLIAGWFVRQDAVRRDWPTRIRDLRVGGHQRLST